MNKLVKGILTGIGLTGAYFFFKDRKKPKFEIVNYHDRDHLKFSDESYLDRRILPLSSAINMRDIGGYTNGEDQQIKWNKIYRGEELSHLSDEDQKKFDDIGFTHIIDFRQPDKAEKKPDKVPEGAQYMNIPVLKGVTGRKLDYDDPQTVKNFMQHIYRAQVEEKAQSFAEVLKILRDNEDAKIYIHCTNGKDRTGIMVAMIMLICGIDRDKILSDYSLTNLTFDEAFDVLGSTMADEVGAPKAQLRDFFGVDPKWLEAQLDYIDSQGGIEAYLVNNTDLTESDIDTIRKNLLEKAE